MTAAGTSRLVVGSFTPSIVLSVARRTGRLAAEALSVEEVPVTSSPGQFSALLSGELDLAMTSPDNVVAYRFDPANPLGRLADVRIVATIDRGMGLGLYARPGLERPGLIERPLIGVDVPTSGFALAMYALLEDLGLDRDRGELVCLGSTPRRLDALRAGRCDLTMLNAGNELAAQAAGCTLLRRVSEVCAPYVGTVLCVLGEERLDLARRLSRALRSTARDIVAGDAAAIAAEEASLRLRLSAPLADRYVDTLRSLEEGLILEDRVDLDGLRTVVGLRRRFMAAPGGADVLASALDATSGLVAPDRTSQA